MKASQDKNISKETSHNARLVNLWCPCECLNVTGKGDKRGRFSILELYPSRPLERHPLLIHPLAVLLWTCGLEGPSETTSQVRARDQAGTSIATTCGNATNQPLHH